VLLCALVAAHPAAHAADGIEIVQAHLEPGPDGYRLSATYAFDLTHGLEDALARGVPLYLSKSIVRAGTGSTKRQYARPRPPGFPTMSLRANTARPSLAACSKTSAPWTMP